MLLLVVSSLSDILHGTEFPRQNDAHFSFCHDDKHWREFRGREVGSMLGIEYKPITRPGHDQSLEEIFTCKTSNNIQVALVRRKGAHFGLNIKGTFYYILTVYSYESRERSLKFMLLLLSKSRKNAI